MTLAPTQSGGGVAGAITQLYDSVAAVGVASFDVQGISGAYTHLWGIFEGRSDEVALSTVVNLRFNNDSGANYYGVDLVGNAAALTTNAQVAATALRLGGAPAASALANTACVYSFWVRDYASTTFVKGVTGTGGRIEASGSAGTVQEDVLNFWNNTAAVTRITILPSTSNWVAGSRFSLYGVL